MLIGGASNKPSLDKVRSIKFALREALALETQAMVTVTQLACLEEDCAPLETVIGLLDPGTPQRQHKVHKATEAINADDLGEVCRAWGHNIEIHVIEEFLRRPK